MMFPVTCPLASVYVLRPGAGCFCILLISPLIPPLEYIDNLYTNSPITALYRCSLTPVDERRRPLPCFSEHLLSSRSCTSTAKCLSSLRSASLGFPSLPMTTAVSPDTHHFHRCALAHRPRHHSFGCACFPHLDHPSVNSLCNHDHPSATFPAPFPSPVSDCLRHPSAFPPTVGLRLCLAS